MEKFNISDEEFEMAKQASYKERMPDWLSRRNDIDFCLRQGMTKEEVVKQFGLMKYIRKQKSF